MNPNEYIHSGTCTEAQGFGENDTGVYHTQGYLGHTGIDVICGWGTPIKPFVPIYVYKILTVEHPSNDGTGFTGVFGIDADGNEWLYGHCDPTCVVGKWYQTTDTIGTEANHGSVFQGGVEITLAMQAAGDQRGHHRHVQYRLCDKRLINDGSSYLTTTGGGYYQDAQGFYYQFRFPDNGFAGCIDWSLQLGSLSDKLLGAANVLTAQHDPDATSVQWFAALVKKLMGK